MNDEQLVGQCELQPLSTEAAAAAMTAMMASSATTTTTTTTTTQAPVQRIWLMRLSIAATSISLFVRLIASFIVAAYDGWLRRQQAAIKRFKDRLVVPSVVVLSSRLSFSALSEAVTYPSNKIDPILQTFRVINFKPGTKWFPKREIADERDCCHPEPEKSVNCEILYDPVPEQVRADVIFIHGLHGSIVHTWKQGLWDYRKQVRNQPLQHKLQLAISGAVADSVKRDSEGSCNVGVSERLCLEEEEEEEESHIMIDKSCAKDHDPVLENITDIINNIDDKIKGTIPIIDRDVQEQEPYSPCWPRDWLPKDCPGVRVIAVNYTTDPFLWRPVWITKRIRTSMTQRSREMEEHLLKMGVGQHPIIWVGHSKGGLFVKQMLVNAKESEDQRLARFLKQTRGIMFYSVPHRGSSLAHINLPLLRQSIELTEVKKDCQQVLDLHRQFMKLYEDKSLTAEVFSFVETILTFMFVTNVRVVSVDSADLGVGAFQGVNIDHREICKPLSRECFLYKELASLINRVV